MLGEQIFNVDTGRGSCRRDRDGPMLIAVFSGPEVRYMSLRSSPEMGPPAGVADRGGIRRRPRRKQSAARRVPAELSPHQIDAAANCAVARIHTRSRSRFEGNLGDHPDRGARRPAADSPGNLPTVDARNARRARGLERPEPRRLGIRETESTWPKQSGPAWMRRWSWPVLSGGVIAGPLPSEIFEGQVKRQSV